MGEATSSRATVGREHVIGPVLRQVMNRIGIATIDDVGFLYDVALALEKAGMRFFTLEVGFNLFSMGSFGVDVNADQDFVGQGLEGPPNEGLEDLPWHVNLGEVTATLRI
jgi:hypothetical protein